MNEDRHKLLQTFLKEWPLNKVRNISLGEYVQGAPNYKETFSYWVETPTEKLGNISGMSGGGSFKFGIYYKGRSGDYDLKRHKDDGSYAWEIRFGDDRGKAFNEIKKRVVAVIENSIKGNFEAIENVDKLFPLFKWKLAYLYSGNKLFPIYKKEWLTRIAVGLGYEEESTRIVDLQRFIMTQYPKNEDFFEWYDRIIKAFIKSPNNFYVVGSNYSGEEDVSILKNLYSKNVIAVGFYWKKGLEKLYNKPVDQIRNFLYKQNEPTRSVQALTKFLSIKEGDVVAVKNYGWGNSLNIAAYSVVKPDENGIIYKFDEDLGHTLNVEFVEKDADLELNYNKSHTVHQITDEEEINTIFGAYQNIPIEEDTEEDSISSTRNGRKGVKKKKTDGYTRKVSYSATIDQFHDRLQTQFFEALKLEKGDPDALQSIMEEGHVDVKYENGEVLELYEIKTSPTAKKCVREALGQIIFYASQVTNGKQPKIFVVGPSKIKAEDKTYINYVKKNSKLDFEYRAFSLKDEL